MCGLVGVSGALQYKDEILMKRLLLLDFFRGPDSTGFAAIRTNGDAVTAKLSSHPLDLFEMPKFKAALNGNLSQAFIGHNRAATRGGVNTVNAHPFTFGHITGAHNGTLDYKSVNRLEEALGEKYPVDSQALFAAIERLGIEEAISLCAEGRDSQQGAWALVWYDAHEHTMNFLKNRHRPLWYAFEKDFKRMFWASEWPMIEGASRLGGYDLFTEEKTNHRYWQFDDDVHFKVDLAALVKGSDKRPKPVARTIKGREPDPVVASTGGHDPFKRDAFLLPGESETNIHIFGNSGSAGTTPKKTGTTTDTKSNVTHLFGSDANPLGGYLSEGQFERFAKYGCSWCGSDVHFGEPGMVIIERDEVVICPECVCASKKDEGQTRIFTKNDLYLS